MFVAWRDLRFARGRFVLVGSVVALITLLVGFLAGLTGGLAEQNVSGVLALPGDRLVLAPSGDEAPSFAKSEIEGSVLSTWRDAAGVTAVAPIGIVQSRAEGPAGTEPVALIGMDRRTSDSGAGALTSLAPADGNTVGLSAGAAKALGAEPGDELTISGSAYRVARIGGDLWYSHTPMVVMTRRAWAAVDTAIGGSGSPTVLAVSGSPDWDEVAAETGTSAKTPLMSLTALETFRSEIGSLGLMIAMLFGVSALVVGAFFTVWTLQRTGDIAVLKALGASTGSLIRDSLGQALIVLTGGTVVGLAAVVGLGALAGSALPFLISPLTTLLPAAAMIALGLVGAVVALRPVTSVDPLTALGSSR